MKTENERNENIIPEQFTGKTLDYKQSVDFTSTLQADDFFMKARLKLLDVNHWHHIAKGVSAVFSIVDEQGTQLSHRLVEKNDFIKIDIPGPGLPSSDGFDWVKVEDVVEEHFADLKRIALTLRPCPDPSHEGTDTAHFFKNIATSSIIIKQKETSVCLQYAGRNEVINMENESNLDKVRNFIIGLGAKMGASFPQWKALIDGLSQREE
ncbi:hypothetical protein G5B30_07170 [Sphingobacterium sp. SGG-5]|uniref:hypothetical protein n=1 Tax=Sphingobacterium sp. SGG-5 TaxID=2710881 RepID=UPI0013EB1408|nr:hypothetical protein [Sphingobacterium sp. SGG-5]NGM61696.1 hypothetical protein [Sphingobacterium sp. SGG-5]